MPPLPPDLLFDKPLALAEVPSLVEVAVVVAVPALAERERVVVVVVSMTVVVTLPEARVVTEDAAVVMSRVLRRVMVVREESDETWKET